jgi:hypothetical protein
VLHPSSRIWLAGSVRFSTWLDWFQKIGHLAKIGGGTARTRSTEKKIKGTRKKKKNEENRATETSSLQTPQILLLSKMTKKAS